MNDLTLGIYQKLGEVPGDYSTSLHGVVAAQELVDRVCAWAVNLDFGEQREVGTFLTGELLDFGVRSGLLPHELVAWEGKDLESLTA